ncbi:MAG: hypothetical protein ABH851_06725 [Methanobacteriota archaeon]
MKHWKLAFVVFWTLLFNLFVGISFGGADFGNYLNMANSLAEGHFIVSGQTLGPTGLMVVHHSVGPSLLYAPLLYIKRIVSLHSILMYAGSTQYLYPIHWVLAPLMVLFLWDISRRIGVTQLQGFVALISAFFGTSLFYYTFIALSS